MEMHEHLSLILETVQAKNPIVHHMTNYVTANDSANIVLALGGSPVMADDPMEAPEMTEISSALVLNLGTLSETRVEAFLLAGQKANERGIPVVLDPVGAGVTALRNQALERIMSTLTLSVIRGNQSEIRRLYGMDTAARGVDSADHSLEGLPQIVAALAKRLSCTIAVTGEVDIVSDGCRGFRIENGCSLLSRITGTGCMTSSLTALCCGTGADPLYAALTGIGIMGIAGEKAAHALKAGEGLGSFKMRLMDAVSTMTAADLRERGKIYEIKV
jgi:hydroxyethylthiazole kinase